MNKDDIKKAIIDWRKNHTTDPDTWWYCQNLLGNVLGWPLWYAKFIKSLDEIELAEKLKKKK